MSCLPHLLIRGKLLDHYRITKDNALELMVKYFRVDLCNALMEIKNTRVFHVRFRSLERLYAHQLNAIELVNCDDYQVMQHITYALRTHLLYLVGTSICMDKSSYYIYVVYL